MEGISAIASRVAQIRQLVEPPVVVAPRATATGTGTSFADALARETASVGRGAPVTTVDTSPSSVRRASGGMVPAGLAGFENGRIPADALSPVGSTGHKLWQPAAQQLERLLGDAAAQGVDIGITDSYRTYDTQVDLVRRKGLYSQGGLAARPGTSDHGWGLAVDLDLDAKAQAWMRANAGRYGFAESTPREPWHWSFET